MNVLRCNLLAIVLVFILLQMVACAPNIIEESFPAAENKVINSSDSIVVKKARIKKFSGIKKFTEARMVVDFTLYNNQAKRKIIKYRVQWLDKNGALACPYGFWSFIPLDGQKEITMTVTSSSNEAEDYRLELQTS